MYEQVLGITKIMNTSDWSLKNTAFWGCIYWKELGYEGGGQDSNRQQGKFEGEQF